MSDRSPAFQYYPKDLLSDAKVQMMTLEAVGAYWKLISFLWVEGGTLPKDHVKLSKLLGVSEDVFSRLWEQIGGCFSVEADSIHHDRLDKERKLQHDRYLERSKSGKSGNAKRWGSDKSEIAERSLSDKKSIAKRRSASASSSASASASSIPEKSIDQPSVDLRADDKAIFYEFWAVYPRKVGKVACFGKWQVITRKVSPTVLMEALRAQIASGAFLKDDPALVPHPLTWLNQGRWEDEIVKSNGNGLKQVKAFEFSDNEKIEMREASRKALEKVQAAAAARAR